MLLFAVPPVAYPHADDSATRPLRVVALVPARFDSSRLPGKALADLAGRPMIEHVWRRAAAARGVGAVIVATDDVRIVEAVERSGGRARLTSPAHRSGTDRIAEVAASLDCDVVVNVQGDEPLLDPDAIDAILAPFADPDVRMTTACVRLTDPDEAADPHVVKVVVDTHGDALYFSRAPIPYDRGGPDAPRAACYKHLGLYAYRRDFLLAIARLPRTPLEDAESLEQLRVLEHGFRIRTVETSHDSVGVDTPADLERVRRQLLAAVRT